MAVSKRSSFCCWRNNDTHWIQAKPLMDDITSTLPRTPLPRLGSAPGPTPVHVGEQPQQWPSAHELCVGDVVGLYDMGVVLWSKIMWVDIPKKAKYGFKLPPSSSGARGRGKRDHAIHWHGIAAIVWCVTGQSWHGFLYIEWERNTPRKCDTRRMWQSVTACSRQQSHIEIIGACDN